MDVFVYGTLTDPEQAGAVLDSVEFVGRATLSGCHRVNGAYPTLAPGGEVDGRLLRTADIRALDEYEGVDRGLYVRVTVPLVADDAPGREVAVYVGNPEALDAPAEWPGDGPFRERVRAGLADHDAHVSFK